MDETYIANLVARCQFGFTIGMHVVLATFSIGLANYLMVLEALWLWKKEQAFIDLFNYWLKIFALTFAVGVVSGVVMEYQFGTNWSAFATKTGAIIGPLMMYEVVVAFFLESGFIGVMLFGMKKVGKRLHFLATVCVALGSLFSAFWILSANSWMQTPAGYELAENGRFVPVDWWAIIFNPSFPYRLAHMTLAAFLVTAFLVGGVGAWHLLRDRTNAPARIMFSMALWMAALVAPLQMSSGTSTARIRWSINRKSSRPWKAPGSLVRPVRDSRWCFSRCQMWLIRRIIWKSPFRAWRRCTSAIT
ncbi:MAG: cytochrome bd ubiquinol oxidase subunit [Caballeronia sp.]|nr:cytochrome bd ubiquinol oxidase subunit [Caballeronia sp.]